MKRHIIYLIITILLFPSCATVAPLKTASGKPEVAIPNISKKQITNILVNAMLSSGCNVKSSSEYNIIFTKPMNSLGASLLLGSQYDVTPEERIIMNILEANRSVRIVITDQAITNPGSAFERITDLTSGKNATNWQNFLNTLADQLSYLRKGRVGISIDASGTITDIEESSPAQLGGMKIGDKILLFDGKPFSNVNEASSLSLGDPETIVTIDVFRNGEKLTFKITRKVFPKI